MKSNNTSPKKTKGQVHERIESHGSHKSIKIQHIKRINIQTIIESHSSHTSTKH